MAGNLRIFITTLVAAAAVAACGGDTGNGSDTSNGEASVAPADLVLRGGTIATVDDALGNVEALAVNGYQVTAVGSNDEIAAYIGPDTDVIELAGRFVMPGFIEGHGHFLSLGRSKQILDLNDVQNWDEIVSMVAVAVDKARPGEYIFGRGWHQDKWDSPAGQRRGRCAY